MPRKTYAYSQQEAPAAASEKKAGPGEEKAPTTLSELEEESRVDPYDGEVRTFEELRLHYAGIYTPEAILDYWQSSCKPYLQGFFEGAWAAGSKRHVIEGPRLQWHMGRITIIEATSRSSFSMELDGSVYSARLEDGGRRLVWSDGEAWERLDEHDPDLEERDLLAEPDEAPPLREPTSAKAYSPGQRVKYYSTNAQKWILALVKGQNPDGTYDLDVKKRAQPEHIRPASTKQAPEPAAAAPPDPAVVARFKMQLPRALAEWAAGDHKGFDNLLATRILATPLASHESVIQDMLKDALAVAPSVGVRPQELQQALDEVKKITQALIDADMKVSKQVKRPVVAAAVAEEK